jgi:hypothetical protein
MNGELFKKMSSVQKKQVAPEFFANMSRTLIIKAADFN